VEARVWGCRGSLATPGADTIRYGGNTSCVEVRLDSGDTLVLDAGTGIRPLGAAMDLASVGELHILLTHLHLDHLQGLGFFRPLFQADAEIHIWGPASPVQELAERIAIYLSPPLFPVRLADVPARLIFHNAPDQPVTIGSATIRAGNVTHQGPTVGYRIEEGDRTLAYLPDHEPSLGIDLGEQPPTWISGHDVAHDADVLLHDGQYGDDEYPQHVGWGHSAMEHVMDFARKASVDNVVLFHHDPYHTDDELDQLLDEALRRSEITGERVCLAREGMIIVLDRDGVQISTEGVEEPAAGG
jgi:phosphoribosyl 1,2-cyclic phosphodiesterase